MEHELLGNNLKTNEEFIDTYIPQNPNVIKRHIIIQGNLNCLLLYLSGMTNQSYIEESILYPLQFNIKETDLTLIKDADYLSKRYICNYSVILESSIKNIFTALNSGKCILILDGDCRAIICDTVSVPHRNITSSKLESNLKGGLEAFVENLEINESLIQQKISNRAFIIKHFSLGEKNPREVSMLYIDSIVDKNVLKRVTDKINSLKIDYIYDVGYLSQYLCNNKLLLFPKTKYTEKPDKVVSDLFQGKIVFLVNGSTLALILPVSFTEFFQAFEDYSNNFFVGNFNRLLRIFSVLIVTVLAPLYLVLLQFNVELIPLNLIKTIISSRLGIPLSPFLEILSMEIIIEFLREGGLRLPNDIAQSLGIVGGIVLGDAAIRAGLVSPTTLVVVAIETISSFSIPNYEMALTLRLIKFPMLILGRLLGFWGLILGYFFLLIHLIGSNSFGVPYFEPFAPFNAKNLMDSVFRFPLNYITNFKNIFKREKNKDKEGTT